MLSGRTVLEWTLSAFNDHPAIESIVIAAGSDEIERVKAISAQFPKVVSVVVGGENRCDSVENGLAALPDAAKYVLVHDAARPLVSSDVINRVLAAAIEHGAAVPGISISDSVKRVTDEGVVKGTLPRKIGVDGKIVSGLTAVQTPQGASVEIIRAAFAKDWTDGEGFDDESMMIQAMGIDVHVVAGDPRNIKITRQEDLIFAESLLSGMGSALPDTRPSTLDTHAFREIRTGFGYDVHAFAEPEANRPLFLGGIEIPHDRGLDGHSDADVIIHAICDALLGAVSLGDIGIQFPNTDAAYKNISSLKLLANVGERLREMQWRIINIDATVVAEAPKLMPHREQMQQTMADCLGLEPSRLSVKATTSEGMGFVGRREGMACWAVATVQKNV